MTNNGVSETVSGYPRLEDQIQWYDMRSQDAEKRYKTATFVELLCAVLVPFTASYSPLITALLGVAIVLLQGIQWLNQWHHNWITYRSTCELLKHEKYLFLEGAGSYKGLTPEQSRPLLAERVEGLVSTEHAKWLVSRKQSFRNKEAAFEQTLK